MRIIVILVLLYRRCEAVRGDVSLYLNGLSLQPCGCAFNDTRLIPKNVIPTRMQVYDDEVFLTYPRYRKGVAFTLGAADLKAPHPVTVTPFPHQEMQVAGDCRALQSAVDVFADARGVLWVLDTGVLESMGRACCACPPKVMALCARTGALVRVVELSGVLGPRARPQFVAAENDADGSVFVYVSDAEGGRGSLWCVCVGGCGGGGARRLWLPAETSASSACDVLDLASLHGLLLLHCRGSDHVFAVDTALLRAGQFVDALTRLAPAASAASLVFLGTDLLHTLYYRLEGRGGEVFSWSVLGRVSARVGEGAGEVRARLTVTAVAARGGGGGGREVTRAPLALAVDFGGYAARRVPCTGAEARIFSLQCNDLFI